MSCRGGRAIVGGNNCECSGLSCAWVQILLQAKEPRHRAWHPTASPTVGVARFRRRVGVHDPLRRQQVVEVRDLARVQRTSGNPEAVLGSERRLVGVNETLVQFVVVLEIRLSTVIIGRA
jgi:hypothetical protein